MKRIIAIGGEKQTGKSTLAKSLLADFFTGTTKTFTYGLLKGYVSYENRLVVIGWYQGGENLPGSDGLSRDVISDALMFIENFENLFQHADQMTVFLEGSRLFNGLFLSACRKHCPDTRLFILKTTREILHERQAGKKFSQNEMRAIRSAIYSVVNRLGGKHLMSDNMNDMEANASLLKKMLK